MCIYTGKEKKSVKVIDNENYVERAEKVIVSLKNKVNPRNGRPVPMVTTSKIRNLLAMTADIYNEVMASSDENLSSDLKARIEYLRVHFVYESGREAGVRNLVQEAGILEILKSMNGTKADYILFNRYMEALVAFHKYYGGKD